MKCDIILTGVGGQGVLLMAELLGISALIEGLDVRVSEIHGMAQRGGSVLCHVRLGKKVYAPTIMEGAADIVVGLEPLETLRTIKYMSNKTLVLINIEPIKPYATTIGLIEYPKIEKILSEIHHKTDSIITLNALLLAKEAGDTITQNVVMLGALSATGKLLIKAEAIENAIKKRIPKKFVELNLRAFRIGFQHTKGIFGE